MSAAEREEPVKRVEFLNVFERLFCSPRLRLYDEKYSKKKNNSKLNIACICMQFDYFLELLNNERQIK